MKNKRITKSQFCNSSGFPEALLSKFIKAFGGWGKIKDEVSKTGFLDLSKVDGMTHDKIKGLFGGHIPEILTCLESAVTREGRDRLNESIEFNKFVDRKNALRAYGTTGYESLVHSVKHNQDCIVEHRNNLLTVAVSFIGFAIASRLINGTAVN